MSTENPNNKPPVTPEVPKDTKLAPNTPTPAPTEATKEKADALKREMDIAKDIKEKNGATINTPFIGMKNEFLHKQVKEGIAKNVQELLAAYPKLTSAQKSNIELAILGKICDSNWISEIAKLTKEDFLPVIQALAEGKYEEADKRMKEGVAKANKIANKFESALADFDMKTAMPTLIKYHFTHIKTALDTHKDSPLLPLFLDNPEAMSKYAGGPLPANIAKPTPEALTKYCTRINEQMSVFDKAATDGKNIMATNGKSLDDILKGMPKELQKMAKEFFEMIFDIPFIGPIIAAMFGIDISKKTPSKEPKKPETPEQKAQKDTVDNLVTYGAKKDADGKTTDGKNAGKIEILKGKDLSALDYTKLNKFFAFWKRFNFDATKYTDLWESVITGKPPIQIQRNDATFTVKMPSFEAADFDDGFKKFYDKCNTIDTLNPSLFTPEEKKLQEKEQEVIKTIQKTVASGLAQARAFPITFTWSEEFKKMAKETNMAYPSGVDFSAKEGQLILGENMKYYITVEVPYGATIESMSIKNDSIALLGSKLWIKKEYLLSKAKGTELLLGLIANGEYTFQNESVTVNMSKNKPEVEIPPTGM